MALMFCPKCGKKLPDTAKFCSNCGHKFEAVVKSEKEYVRILKEKKIVILLGCCILLPVLINFSLFHYPKSEWDYIIDGQVARITGYEGTKSVVVIPQTLKRGWISYDVTEIEGAAFYDCDNLISIEIPESVTTIGYRAFADCDSLTSIEIPGSVTTIGHGAFEGCSSLISIKLPEGVKEIEDYAFYGCSSLTSIDLPDSVTKIGDNAFEGTGIEASDDREETSIGAPDNVTETSTETPSHTIKGSEIRIKDSPF